MTLPVRALSAAEAHGLAEALPALALKAVQQLAGCGLSAALAESCTGGLLAASIASVPGASAVLNSSAVVYQTRAKSSLLGLDAGFVAHFGPVSEEVTRELARAARTKNGADLGIAVTGWAGPSGGTPTDPVGTCYIALDTPKAARCLRCIIPGDRDFVRKTAAAMALELLMEAEG